MKSNDRVKEEIGFYKLLLTIIFATFTSLVSWFWSNADSYKTLSLLVVTLIIFCVISGIYFYIKIDSKIKELTHG